MLIFINSFCLIFRIKLNLFDVIFDLPGVLNRVSVEQNLMQTAPVSEYEVENVIKSFAAEISPRPDGVLPLSIRHFGHLSSMTLLSIVSMPSD